MEEYFYLVIAIFFVVFSIRLPMMRLLTEKVCSIESWSKIRVGRKVII